MAIYHCSVKTISRSSGQSILASAAYRHACDLKNQTTGESFDYGKKRGVLASSIVVPEGVEVPVWVSEREKLWNEAEKSETRKNSRLGREVVIALPAELSQDEQMKLVESFSLWLANRYGIVADAAIHEPSKNGDERNWHAHILISSRRITKEGFGEKTRELDDKKRGPEEVETIRTEWENQVNAALLQAGRGESLIDHRSFESQGKNRVPTIHLGHKAAALERAGITTNIGEYNRNAEEVNAKIKSQECELSRIQEQEALLMELAESSRLHDEMIAAGNEVEAANANVREKEKELAQYRIEQTAIFEETTKHNQEVEHLGFFEQMNPFKIRKVNEEADNIQKRENRVNQAIEKLIQIITELKKIADKAMSRWNSARAAYSESILGQYEILRSDALNALEELYGDSICKLICPDAVAVARSMDSYKKYLEKMVDADPIERSRMQLELNHAEKRYEVQEILYELAKYVSRDTSITGRQRLRDQWLKEWDSASQDRREEMVLLAKQQIALRDSHYQDRWNGYSR